MISSLNHHISIVKLSIHQQYLEFLSSGEMPSNPSSPSWCSPTLQRTRWFNLFCKEDRVEAMRELWGLMSYLMRYI